MPNRNLYNAKKNNKKYNTGAIGTNDDRMLIVCVFTLNACNKSNAGESHALKNAPAQQTQVDDDVDAERRERVEWNFE